MKENHLDRGWQAVSPDFRRIEVYTEKLLHHVAEQDKSHNMWQIGLAPEPAMPAKPASSWRRSGYLERDPFALRTAVETSRLLMRAGFLWHADMFDSDAPYRLDTSEGTLVGMPFTMEVNEMPLYVRYGNEPEAFARTPARIIEGCERLGSPFVCIDISVHAHVFGRPYGAIAFLDALELAA